jgi:hypothetical protein
MNNHNRKHEKRPFWGWDTFLALTIVALLGGAIFYGLWRHGIQEGRRQVEAEESVKVREVTVPASPMENELKSLPVQDADRIIAEAKQQIEQRKSGIQTSAKDRESNKRKKHRIVILPRQYTSEESDSALSHYSSVVVKTPPD